MNGPNSYDMMRNTDDGYSRKSSTPGRDKYYGVMAFLLGAALMIPYIALMTILYIVFYKFAPLLFFTITFAIFYLLVLGRFVRFALKRAKLSRGLKKFKNAKITYLSGLYSRVFRPSGKTDITVETNNTVFDIMLFPTPKRLTKLIFDEHGNVTYITRFQKNKFHLVFGIKEKRRTRPIEFCSRADEKAGKRNVKIILLCPVPYEAYVPKKEDLGGIGDEINGMTLQNASGLFRLIENDL
ncbi:MAG: hypothetical protein KBS59_05335 [Clostridiales bacterium]|nr:hypothetical protein [Clostridiales bacterium]